MKTPDGLAQPAASQIYHRLVRTYNALAWRIPSLGTRFDDVVRSSAVRERTPLVTGSGDLRLPDELRHPLDEHLGQVRRHYAQRGWGGRVGFGKRPALLVIDLALFWTRPDTSMGSFMDPVVEAVCRALKAARVAGVPVFFSTYDYDPAEPPSPHDGKLKLGLRPGDEGLLREGDEPCISTRAHPAAGTSR